MYICILMLIEKRVHSDLKFRHNTAQQQYNLDYICNVGSGCEIVRYQPVNWIRSSCGCVVCVCASEDMCVRKTMLFCIAGA
jgi:hypothetical protein